MKRTARRPRLMVTTGGEGVVAHVGARLLCELADDLSLTERLSEAMAPTKQRRRGHDRGEVLVDLAVALADGATTISDLRVLSTARPLRRGGIGADGVADPRGGQRGRTGAHRGGTGAGSPGGLGGGMDPGFYVIDIDGTLIDAHSEKEEATATYKHGFGFYPLVAYLDATGEALAALLRRGNVGSGTAADHIVVLEASLAQLPVDPTEHEIIVRTDSGGTTHALAQACVDKGVRFIGGFRLKAELAQVVTMVPKRRWKSAISSDGTEELETGQVAEVTDLVDLSGWPPAAHDRPARAAPSRGPAQLHRRGRLSLPGLCYRSARPRHLLPRSAVRGRVESSAPSVTPKTPGWPTCPATASPSTPPGWPPS